ncbi:Nucleotidyltransferase [Guyanagaster necrorhizus]|uniref:DNA polymerase n=1 Tax=Guyanagaster necrorhizus TaxID=856835 RepID=A0A9P8AVM2_9AGAR|nr:Nucleotidyltransferase [Guyanagaster necrorhizus MCA 3950]KAG7449688.1 Nucleotidyltransferase [Guyanagaster necrorhizus MCA 3950]
MSPKRPHLVYSSSSSPSRSLSPQPKRFKSSIAGSQSESSTAIVNPLRVHIIEAKLKVKEIAELRSILESGKVLCDADSGQFQLVYEAEAKDADVIVTAVKMRKRLERYIDWDLAVQKFVITPDWLRDCAKEHQVLPYDEYIAVRSLRSSTQVTEDLSTSVAEEREDSAEINYRSPTSCLRLSPLECPNQELAEKLDVLRHSRELEGKIMNTLAYERAIATIKAYPFVITEDLLKTEVSNLSHMGVKTVAKIKEYLQSGTISEAESIAEDPRYQTLTLFTSIYGIGPAYARHMYDVEGLRTIKDLMFHYENLERSASAEPDVSKQKSPYMILTTTPEKTRVPTLTSREAVQLHEELNDPILRDETERMHATIMKELGHLQPGCTSTITGSYRRGKKHSNDVDIVITHENLKTAGDQVKSLCEQLVHRLYSRGMITHLMGLSNFGNTSSRTAERGSLYKVMSVFLPPSDGPSARLHRRLDLIFTTPELYWTAVVGWTGSKMFERDLRMWAKDRGFKFDSSGIVRRQDSHPYFPKSEAEVFELLELPWIEPTMRNADI